MKSLKKQQIKNKLSKCDSLDFYSLRLDRFIESGSCLYQVYLQLQEYSIDNDVYINKRIWSVCSDDGSLLKVKSPSYALKFAVDCKIEKVVFNVARLSDEDFENDCPF